VVLDQAGSLHTRSALRDHLRRSRVLINLLLQDARPFITQLKNEDEAMKKKFVGLMLVVSVCGCISMAQSAQVQPEQQGGHEPPSQAYADCQGKKAGDTVLHMTREGKVAATCVESNNGLVARPNQPRGARSDARQHRNHSSRGTKSVVNAKQYSIEQAISDQAQLHTIAFNGFAFITGDFSAATFIPPGKVCDFFGFQYMRDIDAAQKGHNPMFLDRVAANVLQTLNEEQRSLFAKAARQEVRQFRALAEKRFPLIKAFYRELKGDIPPGSKGLNKDAVMRYVGEIFTFDAELSYQRAQIFGQLATSLTPGQKALLSRMKFGDFSTWTDIDVEKYKLPRGTEKLVNVAYMTYASEFFSWYAGSVDTDVYFCPERHGTYFGGFYVKDIPAMGKRNYDISTSLTGDSGEDFLNVLTEKQRKNITAITDLQSKVLQEIIEVRREIALELRKFLKGGQANKEKVLALGRRYGELDGEMSYYYASAFAKVYKTLTVEQKEKLTRMRTNNASDSKGPFLYSSPINMPKIENTDFFFGVR
jgi:hypothetical protein